MCCLGKGFTQTLITTQTYKLTLQNNYCVVKPLVYTNLIRSKGLHYLYLQRKSPLLYSKGLRLLSSFIMLRRGLEPPSQRDRDSLPKHDSYKAIFLNCCRDYTPNFKYFKRKWIFEKNFVVLTYKLIRLFLFFMLYWILYSMIF